MKDNYIYCKCELAAVNVCDVAAFSVSVHLCRKRNTGIINAVILISDINRLHRIRLPLMLLTIIVECSIKNLERDLRQRSIDIQIY